MTKALPKKSRERLVRQKIRDESTRYLEESKKLNPRWYGCVPVGSIHVRYFLLGECLSVLLNQGLEKAKDACREIARNWNKKREYQVHIWEETAFDLLERRWAEIKNA